MFSTPLRWALQIVHFGSESLLMGTRNLCKPLLHDELFALCLPGSLLGSPPLTSRGLVSRCRDAFTKFLSLWSSCLLSVLWHLLLALLMWQLHWPQLGSLSQNLWHNDREAQVTLLWTCQALLSWRYHKEVLDMFPHWKKSCEKKSWICSITESGDPSTRSLVQLPLFCSCA